MLHKPTKYVYYVLPHSTAPLAYKMSQCVVVSGRLPVKHYSQQLHHTIGRRHCQSQLKDWPQLVKCAHFVIEACNAGRRGQDKQGYQHHQQAVAVYQSVPDNLIGQ